MSHGHTRSSHEGPAQPVVDHRCVTDFDFDYIVVGSGFGGSVSGLRLTEKGYRVLMLKGQELGPADFPKSNWNLKRWLWMPQLGWRGLFKMTFFRHVTVLSASASVAALWSTPTLADPQAGVFCVAGLGPPRRLADGARAALSDGAAHARRCPESQLHAGRPHHEGRRRRHGQGVRRRPTSPSTSASPTRPSPTLTSTARAPSAPAATTAAVA